MAPRNRRGPSAGGPRCRRWSAQGGPGRGGLGSVCPACEGRRPHAPSARKCVRRTSGDPLRAGRGAEGGVRRAGRVGVTSGGACSACEGRRPRAPSARLWVRRIGGDPLRAGRGRGRWRGRNACGEEALASVRFRGGEARRPPTQKARRGVRRASGRFSAPPCQSMPVRRARIISSASRMMREISSSQVGMSLISPATMPQDQTPASISPCCITFG